MLVCGVGKGSTPRRLLQVVILFAFHVQPHHRYTFLFNKQPQQQQLKPQQQQQQQQQHQQPQQSQPQQQQHRLLYTMEGEGEVPERKKLKAVIAGGTGATGKYLLLNLLKTQVSKTLRLPCTIRLRPGGLLNPQFLDY